MQTVLTLTAQIVEPGSTIKFLRNCNNENWRICTPALLKMCEEPMGPHYILREQFYLFSFSKIRMFQRRFSVFSLLGAGGECYRPTILSTVFARWVTGINCSNL
jgi:hypothetical protein